MPEGFEGISGQRPRLGDQDQPRRRGGAAEGLGASRESGRGREPGPRGPRPGAPAPPRRRRRPGGGGGGRRAPAARRAAAAARPRQRRRAAAPASRSAGRPQTVERRHVEAHGRDGAAGRGTSRRRHRRRRSRSRHPRGRGAASRRRRRRADAAETKPTQPTKEATTDADAEEDQVPQGPPRPPPGHAKGQTRCSSATSG